MQRTVVVPAVLDVDALGELKSWLGISRSDQDHILVNLLRASLAMCEAFIGQVPLAQETEERLPSKTGQHELVSRPVREVLSTEQVDAEGERIGLDPDLFEYAISTQGEATLSLRSSVEAVAVITRARTGIASNWAELPTPLKQGVIRLAAYHYRDRDSADNPAPPASVAALWRPWRRLGIA